ncbi:ribonuclease Z [candidate division MSBL1 archaeon SCGC-AAA261G05]|uniref:Ribonuclease Z n=2 Tax=candidate division MSBL1 TaxID=215777 RepID=A0A133VA88_9EURY|nr:ribonuclease Z [candidate division MSBL1 archaeon SCGC-AAA261G05]KXB04446.1 ribonuclease Z [candidate division MSBL1 archaeon SCGC-AAA261O19]
MKLKIIFLGTSGSMPTAERGLTSIIIRREGEVLIFDCGEGSQRQMIRAGFSPMKIDAIFITHYHGDHFLGIAGLVQTLSLMDRERKLEIYGPPGTEEKIGTFLTLPTFTLKFEVQIQDITPGAGIRRKGYEIRTCETQHGVPGIAYALVEDERPGKFYPEKAEELGVKPGPDFSRLQNGEEIEAADGSIVKPDQVMGPPRPGRKIVYSGDTKPIDQMIKFSQGADILIHDATLASDLQELADEGGHSTPIDAAKIAKEAGVERLILTHVSPRYPDSSELEDEAKEVFPDTRVAEDFMELEVELKD